MRSVPLGMLSLLLISFLPTSFASVPVVGVVYGTDDRKDVYQVTNPLFLKLADSTVALFNASDIKTSTPGNMSVDTQTLTQSENVCSTEPYASQPTAAICSRALIGKDLVLTAGHCVEDQDDCDTIRYAFGYQISIPGVMPAEIPEREIYSCKKIVHFEHDPLGADFTIVQLDREVANHDPLKLADRAKSTIAKGISVLLVGHPSGLPTKLDVGAVRNGSPTKYFVANLDSFDGNSGSPIFNATTGEIEGVLVRGDDDFVLKGSCYVSKVCPENGCRGEEATKVSVIAPFVPKE